MRKMLVSACLCLIVLTAACRPQTEAGQPEPKKPAPLVPTESPVMRTPKFGISTANATHEYKLAAGQHLTLKGWYAADQQLAVSYELNGAKAAARLEAREDVRKNHADYKHVQGWVIFVPAAKLKPENKLLIRYGDKTWPMTVKMN